MADDKVTAAARDALSKVPQFLLRGVDPSKLKVVVTPNSKQGYHSDAIASVDVGDPNTIQIHDADAFLKPGAAVQTIAHELTHVQQNRVNPSIKFQPISKADPYGYDENNIHPDSTKYSPEQLGSMVQKYANIQNAPNLNAQQKAQLSAPLVPTLTHFAALPQTTITPTDPDQQGINTTPLPPQVQPTLDSLPLDSDQVEPATVAPPVPQGGSGSQDPFASIAESGPSDSADPFASIAENPTHAQENQQNLREGFKGVGKSILGAIVGDPSVASINPLVHARQLANDQELNKDLESSNPEQTAGKIAAGGVGLALGAGEGFFNKIEKGTAELTSLAADNTLPGRSVNALHTDIESVAQKVAKAAGVEVKPTDNIRKVLSNTVDAIRAKGQEKLDQIDEVYKGLKFSSRGTGGKFISGNTRDLGLPEKFSGFDEQISKLSQKLQSMSGASNVEARANINSQIQELTRAKSQAANALDRQGLGTARADAERLLAQADELDKLKVAHNLSNYGPPGPGAKTNPIKFKQAIEPLHESGSLHAAVGPENAEALMDAADRSARTFRRASAIQNTAKAGAKLAVRGAAEGLGAGTAFRTVEGLTK